MIYRFDDFVLDVQRGHLTGPAGEITLRPKVFDLLVLLVRRAPSLVTREELQAEIWGVDHISRDAVSRLVSELRQALEDDPRSPRFVKNVHGRGYRLESRVSNEIPGDSNDRTMNTSPDRRWRPLALAIAAFAGIAAVGLMMWPTSNRERPRPAIVVTGFENLRPAAEDEWFSSGISDALRLQLAESEGVRVVSPDSDLRVGAAYLPLESDSPRVVTRPLGERFRADWLISGSYSFSASETDHRRLRVTCRVLRVSTGDQTEIVASGSEGDIVPIVVELAAAIYGQLGLEAIPVHPTALFPSLPAEPGALRDLVLGREALRRFDPLAARVLLEGVCETVPSWPLAHWSLARALDVLGYQEEALQSVERALSLAVELRAEERLMIEGLGHKLAGDMEASAQSYRSLFAFFPDNLDYGLMLAETLYKSTQLESARQTLQELRRLPTPLRHDVRIDFSETFVLNGLGRYEEMLEVATAAMSKAEATEHPMLVAFAEYRLGEALSRNDFPGRAADLLKSAADRFWEAGDQWNAARSRFRHAQLLMLQGDRENAAEEFEWATQVSRRIGYRKGVADGLLLAGRGALARFEVDQALRMAAEAGEIYSGLDNRWGQTAALIDEGLAFYAAGPLQDAHQRMTRALDLAREAGQRQVELVAMDMIALVQWELGAADEAFSWLEKSRARGLEWGSDLDLGAAVNLAALEVESGKLDQAGPKLIELLGRVRGSRPAFEKSVLLSQARIELARGRLDMARKVLLQALEIPSLGAARADELANRSLLAELHLQEGRLNEASEILAEVDSMVPVGAETAALAEVWETRAELEKQRGNELEARELVTKSADFYRRTGRIRRQTLLIEKLEPATVHRPE